ncbi:MAG TPA: (Fe-S)-binding protein [Elusimicrobia bacterium]|nr:(Fe-S)-binding protein [Elusimicrobiota bacterium]
MTKQDLISALRESVPGRSPLVGFAAADDPLFRENKRVVSPAHALPEDLLPGARTVVAFFIPLPRAVVRSNVPGKAASREWALAYIETNALIRDAALRLKRVLEAEGHAAAVTPATHNFDPETLVSDWSHRHAAFIAGLGRFGLNNMLITDSGCCGRLGSLVTSLELPPDPRPGREACLFRHDGSCQRCAARCVGDALSAERFDRKRCYAVCLHNEERHRELGKADVCGKCLAGVPCSFVDPVRAASRET